MDKATNIASLSQNHPICILDDPGGCIGIDWTNDNVVLTAFFFLDSKISSTVVSLFASNYVMHWAEYFGQDKLQYAPCFDSRTVCYPNDKVLRDYLSWRQADCKV